VYILRGRRGACQVDSRLHNRFRLVESRPTNLWISTINQYKAI
jgi:hypothetical protein